MEDLVALLIPIFICVVLPVSIVLIISLSETAKEKQKANIIIKAIEANNNIDADKLAESLRKPVKTALQILNTRLLCGCVFTLLGAAAVIYGIYSRLSYIRDISYLVSGACLAIGLGFLVTYFVTRKQINKDGE